MRRIAVFAVGLFFVLTTWDEDSFTDVADGSVGIKSHNELIIF